VRPGGYLIQAAEQQPRSRHNRRLQGHQNCDWAKPIGAIMRLSRGRGLTTMTAIVVSLGGPGYTPPIAASSTKSGRRSHHQRGPADEPYSHLVVSCSFRIARGPVCRLRARIVIATGQLWRDEIEMLRVLTPKMGTMLTGAGCLVGMKGRPDDGGFLKDSFSDAEGLKDSC
jgi:hypothetical protein